MLPENQNAPDNARMPVIGVANSDDGKVILGK
jgi:hypothetical protein